MMDLPNASKSDEEFRERCNEIVREQPDNQRLQYMMNVKRAVQSWEDYDRVVEGRVFNFSYCQLVCMLGLGKRKEMYRSLVNSGRIEEGEPRLADPTGRANPDGAMALLK